MEDPACRAKGRHQKLCGGEIDATLTGTRFASKKLQSSDLRLQTEDVLHVNRLLVNRLNLVLVQILKQEWPHNWPTFISDIVAASKVTRILRLHASSEHELATSDE